jgi:hypothetical protein
MNGMRKRLKAVGGGKNKIVCPVLRFVDILSADDRNR